GAAASSTAASGLSSVALRADEDGVRAGRDVEVRRNAVEVMEAVDVVEEDGLAGEAHAACGAEEGGAHGEGEWWEEEGLGDDDDPGGRKEEGVPEAEEERRVVREGVVELEGEAGMHGEVREPSVEVIEAPAEGSRMGDEVTAHEAGAVEGRVE